MRAPRSLIILAAAFSLVLAFVVACVGSDPEPDAPVPPDGSTPDTSDAGTSSSNDAAADEDADADAGPPRFCQTQSPLTGISDFFCADFDGTDVKEGFTSTYVPDGGSLDQNTSVFYSAPASFTSSKDAQMFWQKVGATTFAQIDLTFRLYPASLGGVGPPATQDLTVIEVGGVGSTMGIHYASGTTVDGHANYVGYFLQATNCSGACALLQKTIPTAPQNDVWTNVHLVWTKAGAAQLFYNDVTILSTTAYPVTSTTVSLTMGLLTFPNSPLVGMHAFDNVVIAVKRD